MRVISSCSRRIVVVVLEVVILMMVVVVPRMVMRLDCFGIVVNVLGIKLMIFRNQGVAIRRSWNI